MYSMYIYALYFLFSKFICHSPDAKYLIPDTTKIILLANNSYLTFIINSPLGYTHIFPVHASTNDPYSAHSYTGQPELEVLPGRCSSTSTVILASLW